MKKVIFFTMLFLAVLVKSEPLKIKQVVSKPQITFSENKTMTVVQNAVVPDKARIKTAANQFIKIQMGSSYELSVFDQSDVLIEQNPEQKGAEGPVSSFSVQLLGGQIYLKKTDPVKKAELKLTSAFFDWKIPAQQSLDLLIDLNTQEPLVKFCQREGEFQVSLFDHEKKITLKTLEGVQFQGQNEAGQVAFDILLNGRKIPKGHWMQVQKCGFEDVLQKETDFAQMEQLEKEIHQKKALKSKQDKQKADSKYLCHNPYGQLNECAWVLKAGRCQKTRCNAEGKWSGEQLISIAEAPECKSQPFVSKCDF